MTPRRKALLALSAAAAAAVAGAVAIGPRVAGKLAAERAVEELGRRGIQAQIGDMRVGLRSAIATEVCVFDPPPNSDRRAACVDRVEVTFPGGGPLRGQTTPSRVAVLGGTVFGEAEHGALAARAAAWQAHLAASRPSRSPERTERRREPTEGAPVTTEILVTNIDVRLDGHAALPVAGVVLERLETQVGEPTTSVDAHIALREAALPAPLTGSIPAEWDLALRLENGEPRQLQLHPEGRIEVQAPSMLPGLTLRLDGAGVSWPYHLTAFGVELVDETTGPVLSWATATLTLRELTTAIERLYMTNLEVSSPRIHVQFDENGQFALPAALAALAGGDRGAVAPEGDSAPPDEIGSPGAAADEEGSGEAAPGDNAAPAADRSGLWADRVWWERIPQRIALQDVEIHATRIGRDEVPVVLFAERLEYALRIFNFQLDVSLTGGLRRGDASAGTAAIQVIWGWESSHLRLDLDLDNIDLSVLTGLLCDADCAGIHGQLDLQATLREDERGPGMRFSGDLALRDATLPLPLLQQPLVVPSLTYRWEAERTREVEPVALRFSTGELTVGEARAHIRPALHGFRYDRVPPVRQIDVSFEIPEQNAQVLFDAIPTSLLGPLEGTRLSGTFGFALDFPVVVEPSEDGPVAVRFDAPTRFQRSDATLAIESMPEAVDPRRMLSAFSFTFRGPEDRINRVMRVPAPEGADDSAAPLPLDTHPWARLDDISWFLVATQLYREDGRFFANSGINWYQIRSVLAEAWLERELGRGASTITMQLVKNVLLSHERTIERKLQELFLTYWTTRLVPKERLLEIYLNVIEWGPGINGIVEAADYYFGTTPAELTIGEAVWLSAITPAPARRAQQRALGTPPSWMQRQIADLLRGLAQRRWISETELQTGLAETVRFVGHRTPPPGDGATEQPSENAAGSPDALANGEPVADAVDEWATPPDEAARTGRPLSEAPPTSRLRMLINQSVPRTPPR